MKTKILWKSMKSGLRSSRGDQAWTLGKWEKHTGELVMCESGFHASKNVIDAMRYIDAEMVAQVEVRGNSLVQGDKQCWSEMHILRAWEWTKEDSVALAVYAAELVIGEYEKRYPDDKRPRQAIEAAKMWLKSLTGENRAAARAVARAAEAAARKNTLAKCHLFVLKRLAKKKGT